ncbi:hypothetical protein, partial [Enterococcus cecorum]|uniref:hypothetical protein n=1 Tax=Enterococcus cecorum TaxID=44008 RepID=UPI001AEC4B15
TKTVDITVKSTDIAVVYNISSQKLIYIYQVISNHIKPYQTNNLYGFVCYRIYQIISTIYHFLPLFCHLKSHTPNRAWLLLTELQDVSS